MPRDTARRVLEIEAQAILELVPRLDESFDRAVELLYACPGRVVVTGMGKSGLIAQKISATLASTGTPSLYLHPVEAVHGDLGRIVKGDVLLAISASGDSEQIPRVSPETAMKEVLFEMTRKRLGLTTVTDPDGRLRGMISDGDLRRQMERHGYTLLDRTAAECMTRTPVLIGRRELATRALDVMEGRKITALLVTDAEGRIEGVVHLHDLWETEMI